MVVHTLAPSASGDDGFCVNNGAINLTTAVINPIAGEWLIVRYPIAPIYPGSTINSAVFTTHWYQKTGSNAQTATGTLRMEKTLNPPVLVNGVYEQNRTKTTASATYSLTWDTTAAPTTMQTSTDIKAALQEVIAQPGWARGNAITVFLNFTQDSGSAEVRSFDAGSTVAPTLVIDWTPPAGVVLAPPSATLNTPAPTNSTSVPISWSYSDPDGDPQAAIAYARKLTSSSTWPADTVESLTTQSTNVTFTNPGTYDFRLKVKDATGDWSDYAYTTVTRWGPPSRVTSITPRKSTYLIDETAEFDFVYSDPDNHPLAGYELRWRKVIT